MKYIAVFLMVNVLLFSSFTGMANIRYENATSCKQITGQDCGKQSKHASDNDCSKGMCNAMLSCGVCIFVVNSSVSISATISSLCSRVVPPSAIGELSDYHSSGWNPPKV